MLFLNPHHVTLGEVELDQVVAIAINRQTTRLAVEYSDRGPHAVFIDAPEQRVVVVVTRDLTQDDTLTALAPGLQGSLRFTTAPNASDAGARAYTLTVVVTAIEYELRRERSARQTITCLAISADGAQSPLSMGGGKS